MLKLIELGLFSIAVAWTFWHGNRLCVIYAADIERRLDESVRK